MGSSHLKFACILFLTCAMEIKGATIKEADRIPVTKFSSGAYFREHSHLVPYETTVPVFFKVQFPVFDVRDPGGCKTTDIVCQTQKATFDLAQEMRDFLSTTTNPRQKRQLIAMAAGAAGALLLDSIFSRFSSKLFGSEKEAVDHLYQFQKSYERKNFGMASNLTHILMNEIRRSRRYSIWWETYAQTTQRELLYFIEMNSVSTKVKLGIERCSNSLIPTEFVTPSVLKKSLIHLSQVVNRQGFVLSIPAINIYDYLKVNMADCLITPQNAYVMINVPIVKEVWRVFELVPVAVRYNNQTCHVDRPQNDIIAVSKAGRVEVVDTSISGLCDVVSDHLCMIPKFSKKNDACPVTLYHNASYEVLKSSCNFKCFNSTTLMIYNVEKDLVHVTNADRVEIVCGDARKVYSALESGALEIPVECNCTYVIDGVKYDLGETCMDSSGLAETSNVVPYYWFHLTNDTRSLQKELNSTDMEDRINKILEENAPDRMDTSLENWHYRDSWLVGLSCGVGGLVVTCILFCWCNNRK